MSGLCEHVLNSKCAPQDLDTPDAPRIKQIEDMLNSMCILYCNIVLVNHVYTY